MTQPAFDFESPADAEYTFSVGELSDTINATLKDRFGDGVWVRGEIQGYSERGPHVYFRIVETRDNAKAVLDVSLFANNRARLRPLLQTHRLQLGEGMKVRLFGTLDLYAPTGRISLKMSGIDPRYTLGEMAIERDEIIRRLVASGAYDANRQRQLPLVPLRIGVVTSEGSAAWHDFTKELEQSGFGFALSVIDVRVQGDQAARMVTAAINQFSARTNLDAIVVIRGGGSRSELAAFDAESIAMAIAQSSVPVFTGIGHEIDRSIADEVAHTAFKTPTACAGGFIERVQAFAQNSEYAWSSLCALAARQVEQASSGLLETARRIQQRTVAAVERSDQRLTDRANRVTKSCTRSLDQAGTQLAMASTRLGRRGLQLAAQELQTLIQIEARVRLLDPVHTLARGWSLTRTADGRVIRSTADLAVGDTIVTTLADGQARSAIAAIQAAPTPPQSQGDAP
ncbi:MAG: exodeoxyribonuclease VII large subunit [Actinomycetota bacterium]